MQVTKPMTAANRITGSASMKIGIVPDVSVTMVDENMIDNPTFFNHICNLIYRSFLEL
jgi:hypothetical protein